MKRVRSRRGQGITEYATVIAFVCCLIALAFNLAHGSFFAGISQSYSGVSSSLDRTNRAALEHQ